MDTGVTPDVPISDEGKLILPDPAKKLTGTETTEEWQAKHNQLVHQFNLLLSALRMSRTGV